MLIWGKIKVRWLIAEFIINCFKLLFWYIIIQIFFTWKVLDGK